MRTREATKPRRSGQKPPRAHASFTRASVRPSSGSAITASRPSSAPRRPAWPAAGACYNPPLRLPKPRATVLARRITRQHARSGEMAEKRILIVGGGLAGSEAAWQAARRGLRVDLFEMRPVRGTPVHRGADLAELVCSNSLKSNLMDTTSGLLKEEMRRCDSLIIKVADRVKVRA